MKKNQICPICGFSVFIDFNKRKKIKCSNCHSLERNRMLWVMMERLGLIKLDMDILHFAPEPGLANRLMKISKKYTSADLDITQYQNFIKNRISIDLCNFHPDEMTVKYDLIIIFHVLEHVPCSPFEVLKKIISLLKNKGVLLFCFPIRRGTTTIEDLNSELNPEERKKLFGQHDHMRMFGELDIEYLLKEKAAPNIKILEPESYFTKDELTMYNLPSPNHLSGDTIFYYSEE